jgi:3,4-dihydroxy 2-butanone 4-phosphate synthase / GTP cyclohydrolase II
MCKVIGQNCEDRVDGKRTGALLQFFQMSAQTSFVDVPAAIEEIRAGRMIVVVDDEDRENEGDLTLAAEKVTPEAINFMAKHGRGLVCLAMTEERLDHLRLGPMTAENTSQYGTAFCEAIDARVGVSTGISAYDRARTIQVAIDPATKASDLARPGHVFPLRARKGGVLVRAGRLRLPWIWRGWRAWFRRALFAKS